jgi:hypothetical protein
MAVLNPPDSATLYGQSLTDHQRAPKSEDRDEDENEALPPGTRKRIKTDRVDLVEIQESVGLDCSTITHLCHPTAVPPYIQSTRLPQPFQNEVERYSNLGATRNRGHALPPEAIRNDGASNWTHLQRRRRYGIRYGIAHGRFNVLHLISLIAQPPTARYYRHSSSGVSVSPPIC